MDAVAGGGGCDLFAGIFTALLTVQALFASLPSGPAASCRSGRSGYFWQALDILLIPRPVFVPAAESQALSQTP